MTRNDRTVAVRERLCQDDADHLIVERPGMIGAVRIDHPRRDSRLPPRQLGG